MKKLTIKKHTQIANDIMFYIYRYIDTNICLDELSQNCEISKFHMHRIFKNEFGVNIHESIKTIRLQKASILLLTNPHSNISEIIKLCGYSSQSAFIKVFKEQFHLTPKQWREQKSLQLLQDKITSSNQKFCNIAPKIIHQKSFKVYYIRDKGYNSSLTYTWNKLHSHLLSNNITNFQYMLVFHDTSIITPIDKCNYNGCIILDQDIEFDDLPSLNVPTSMFAIFDFEGNFKEILEFIRWVVFKWLPSSIYEAKINPPFIIYEKNQYASYEGRYTVSFHLPITL